MGYVLIFILILLVIATRWLRRHPEVVMKWMARRMARRFYNQQQQQYTQQQQYAQQQQNAARQTRRRYGSRRGHSSVIPQEYAQDVEFTEIREYTHIEDTDAGSNPEYAESQVSDVEWEEIKIRKK